MRSRRNSTGKGFSNAHLQRLKKSGKIRDFKVKNVVDEKKIPSNKPGESEKRWLEYNLAMWANNHALSFETEKRFFPERKWQLDFFISGINVAVEYEGIFSAKSRHTSKSGFIGDVEKYNKAQSIGITVFRVTAADYQSIIKTITDFYERVFQLQTSKSA